MNAKKKSFTGKALVIGVVAVAMAVVLSAPASAIQMVLKIDLANNNSWDYSYSYNASTPGTITLPNLGITGLDISGSTHTSIQGAGIGFLLSGSSLVSNTTGGAVRIYAEVSDINFGPTALVAAFSGSGTFTNAIGATMHMQWFDDPLNGQGAPGTPGNLLGDYHYTAQLYNDSFSHNGGDFVQDPGLYSMTLTFDYVLPNNGYLTSRGQSESKTSAVPEPTTLLLLGFGFAGLAGVRRFKK